MRKLLAIIVLGLLLSGCGQTTTFESYSKISTENKVIGMSASNRWLAKGIKKLFRKNGWKIVVMRTGSIQTTGSSTGSVNTEAKYKPKTSYEIILSQTRIPIQHTRVTRIPCLPGNDRISYDLTILDSRTGEEAFVAEGEDCTKKIIKDFENQLSAFWN